MALDVKKVSPIDLTRCKVLASDGVN